MPDVLKASDVRVFMERIGGFSKEHLDSINDELMLKFSATQEVVGLKAESEEMAVLRYTTSGNHFTIYNGVWYWLDGPGSQCYMAKSHSYRPQPGASYQYKGNCPNGAGGWYEIVVV
jgi:hypothetical protein